MRSMMAPMQVGDLMAFIQYAMQIIMAFLMIAYDVDHHPACQLLLQNVSMRC